jgi:hypothetical protein
MYIWENSLHWETLQYLFALPHLGPEFPFEKSETIPAVFQAAMTSWYMGRP